MKPYRAPLRSTARAVLDGLGATRTGAARKFFLNCVNSVNLFIFGGRRVNERFSRALAIWLHHATRLALMAASKGKGDTSMFRNFRKAAIGTALAAATLLAAAPAEARDGYHHGGGGDDAAIAIGAGIVGLAIGAAIASDNDGHHHHRDGYYDDYYNGGGYYGGGYYGYADPYPRGYYYRSYPRYRGYDRDYRYDRRDYRHYRGDYGGGYRHGDHDRDDYYRGHHGR